MKVFIDTIYVYCTDFIVNLANIFDLSYYEINAIVFIFLYPLLTLGFMVVYFVQKQRLRRIKKHNKIFAQLRK